MVQTQLKIVSRKLTRHYWQLEIIGKAAKRASEEIRKKIRRYSVKRSCQTAEYFGVVLKIIQTNLPEMKDVIKNQLDAVLK